MTDIKVMSTYGSFSLDIEFNTDCKRIGILGPSGCGKSLTLKSIAGIEKPDGGRVILDDRVLFDSAKYINVKCKERHVGYLFQNYALFPTMTVRENILAGAGGSKKENEILEKEMVQTFRLEGLEDKLPGELSGGEQQRTALARIMASKPAAILLDEPFSALDFELKDRVRRELYDSLSKFPGIIIMVSHDKDELYEFSEVVYKIANGRIAGCDKTFTSEVPGKTTVK